MHARHRVLSSPRPRVSVFSSARRAAGGARRWSRVRSTGEAPSLSPFPRLPSLVHSSQKRIDLGASTTSLDTSHAPRVGCRARDDASPRRRRCRPRGDFEHPLARTPSVVLSRLLARRRKSRRPSARSGRNRARSMDGRRSDATRWARSSEEKRAERRKRHTPTDASGSGSSPATSASGASSRRRTNPKSRSSSASASVHAGDGEARRVFTIARGTHQHARPRRWRRAEGARWQGRRKLEVSSSGDAPTESRRRETRRRKGCVLLTTAFAAAAEAFAAADAPVTSPADAAFGGQRVTLYQYDVCPFCNKVKAFLDYPRGAVRRRRGESDGRRRALGRLEDGYKKVPIVLVGDEELNDSSAIIVELTKRFDASGSSARSNSWAKSRRRTSARGALGEMGG